MMKKTCLARRFHKKTRVFYGILVNGHAPDKEFLSCDLVEVVKLGPHLLLPVISFPEKVSDENSGSNATQDVERDDVGFKKASPLRCISIMRREIPEESSLGWPLLLGANSPCNKETKFSTTNKWAFDLPRLDKRVAIVNQNLEEYDVSAEEESKDESSNDLCSSSCSSPATPSWRLLRNRLLNDSDESREMSVVEWVMNLPSRSTQQQEVKIALPCTTSEDSVESDISPSCKDDSDEDDSSPTASARDKELSLKLISNGCRQFSYRELKQATYNFSSEKLIAEGGCSRVYKGCLPGGRELAVKILKSYEQALNDFALEVEILSSLNHQNITPLSGVCCENGLLISVYDFFPTGSLEENLHGGSVLPWETRFKVGVAIAEALNYLHNQCSPSVIHRDIKSSNILLSQDSRPHLSDFGLAIWGPQTSIDEVVGTFGYIAPEYFMHGRVSDRSDIYSFGVVLLELLSGRKPIYHEAFKGQESLVMWAKPLLDSGNIEELIDPKLHGDFNIDQMHGMVLAATLCINHSAQYRPNANQILQLLAEESDKNEWMNAYITNLKETEKEMDGDDYFTGLSCITQQQLDYLLLDPDCKGNVSIFKSCVDTASVQSTGQKQHFTLEDYLKEQHFSLKDYLKDQRY